MLLFYEHNSDIEFDYINYKGERSHRRASPRFIRFGTSQRHTEPTWFMQAMDLDKADLREFAMSDMTNVKEIGPPEKETIDPMVLDSMRHLRRGPPFN